MLFAKVGKMSSEDLINKISESDRWPLDDWEIGTLGLGYSHMMRRSREEVLKQAKSIIPTKQIMLIIKLLSIA